MDPKLHICRESVLSWDPLLKMNVFGYIVHHLLAAVKCVRQENNAKLLAKCWEAAHLVVFDIKCQHLLSAVAIFGQLVLWHSGRGRRGSHTASTGKCTEPGGKVERKQRRNKQWSSPKKKYKEIKVTNLQTMFQIPHLVSSQVNFFKLEPSILFYTRSL